MKKYSCCKYAQNWKWEIVNNYKRYKERTEQLKKVWHFVYISYNSVYVFL